MNQPKIIASVFACGVILCSSSILASPTPTLPLPSGQKHQIEQVVYDYLTRNPEVLAEASRIYQHRYPTSNHGDFTRVAGSSKKVRDIRCTKAGNHCNEKEIKHDIALLKKSIMNKQRELANLKKQKKDYDEKSYFGKWFSDTDIKQIEKDIKNEQAMIYKLTQMEKKASMRKSKYIHEIQKKSSK